MSLPGTPYLAGSSLTLDRAIGNAARFTGLPLDDVVAMASTIPAAYLGTATAGTVTADWDAAACVLRICDVTCPADLSRRSGLGSSAKAEAPQVPGSEG